MKKIIMPFLCLVLLTGCMIVQDSSYETIISYNLSKSVNVTNQVNSGYKYYLPKELKSIKRDETSEVIKSKYYYYYLYVDLVSYYNKKNNDYIINSDYVFSQLIDDEGISGKADIYKLNDKYVVDVIYNYSRVQVLVQEFDIKEALNNSLTILKSLKYNDLIIKKLLDSNIVSSVEEQVVIFDDALDRDSLDVIEDIYVDEEDEFYDPDVIN